MSNLFKSCILLFFTLMLSFSNCAKEEVNVGSISGVVRDAETNQPIEKVSVALTPGDITKVTDKEGVYSFSELEIKTYTLSYTKEETHVSVSKEINVQAGENKLDVTLGQIPATPSVVSTGSVSKITTATASVAGTVTDLGNKGEVTQHGHVWSTSPKPTISLSTLTNLGRLSQTGSFTSDLADLSPNAVYYVRAYAINTAGVTYGNDIPFKTASVPVTGISLSSTTLTKQIGDSPVTLVVTVSPSDATNKNVTWTSSDASIAIVSDGTVYFVGVGNATITATTEDGGKKATCTVAVTPAVVPVTDVSLNHTTLVKYIGAPAVTLIATVSPNNATNQNVTWSTSNASVATVSDNGTVNFVGAGSATITVTTEDGGKNASCTVVVTSTEIPVIGVSLNHTILTKEAGDPPVTLVATISPSNATNKNVTWSTSNPSVATVSDGVVNFEKAGSATITVTTEDGGKTANCIVTVSGIGGTIGNLRWTIRDGTLTISGTGAMPNNPGAWRNYSQYFSTVDIQSGVTSIGESAFPGCSNLTSITIPNSVTAIGYGAFTYCSSLTSITIPNSVTTIEERAFSQCSSLISITISNSVTTIGYQTFYNCSSLTSITIPNSVTTIGMEAFLDCFNLTSITIPNSVTLFGTGAFRGCTSLTSITIPNSMTTLSHQIFSGCTGLVSITIPNSVMMLSYYVFIGCTSLKNVIVLRTSPPYIDISTDPFHEVPLRAATLIVPKGCKSAYQREAVWRDFGTIVEME
jgi:uncharacterized protein YjdB